MATYFSAGTFKFLTELKAHNNREWFEKNKSRYEGELRDPLLRFISDLGPRLAKISPSFAVDSRPVGGSMMRIYRDIRFSKDKTPYKTAMAAHFEHKKGKEGATPAFYLHLAPKDSMVGGGIWRPEAGALKRIRDAIVSDAKRWEKITRGREFKSACGMHGESLERPPQGYAAEHPFIDDIKRKDFAVSIALDDRAVTSGDLMDAVVERYRTAAPFIHFLTDALGLAF